MPIGSPTLYTANCTLYTAHCTLQVNAVEAAKLMAAINIDNVIKVGRQAEGRRLYGRGIGAGDNHVDKTLSITSQLSWHLKGSSIEKENVFQIERLSILELWPLLYIFLKICE